MLTECILVVVDVFSCVKIDERKSASELAKFDEVRRT